MEETCKKIENYLVEMIVEEGKMRDLMDLEELLLFWKNLSVLSSILLIFYAKKQIFSLRLFLQHLEHQIGPVYLKLLILK